MKKYIIAHQEKLTNIFETMPPPYGWWYALKYGSSKFYANDTVILNYYIADGILVINSMAKDNHKFPKSMLLDIRKLIISHDKVIIASTVQEIAQHMLLKYGFEYDKTKQIYTKGV